MHEENKKEKVGNNTIEYGCGQVMAVIILIILVTAFFDTQAGMIFFCVAASILFVYLVWSSVKDG